MLRAALILMGSAVLLGAAPPKHEGVAARLHDRAREAYANGEFAEAAELWSEAATLHPLFKYTYNLANVLYEDSKPLEAWEALARAQKRGVDDKYLGHVAELRAKLKAVLKKSYARIELVVVPADARVTRNGKPWAGPARALWTRDTSSELEVAAKGYESATVTWPHPIGKRASRTLTLVRIERPVLLVEKEPVVVEQPKPVVVKKPVVVEPPKPDERSHLAIAGWTTAGAGITALGAAVGLLLAADDDARDYNDLSSAPEELLRTYPTHAEYQSAGREIESSQTIGWVVMGVGAALSVTGAVMLVLDSGAEAPEPEASWRVVPLPLRGGGGAATTVRF